MAGARKPTPGRGPAGSARLDHTAGLDGHRSRVHEEKGGGVTVEQSAPAGRRVVVAPEAPPDPREPVTLLLRDLSSRPAGLSDGGWWPRSRDPGHGAAQLAAMKRSTQR